MTPFSKGCDIYRGLLFLRYAMDTALTATVSFRLSAFCLLLSAFCFIMPPLCQSIAGERGALMPCDPQFLTQIRMFDHLGEDDRQALGDVIDETTFAGGSIVFHA